MADPIANVSGMPVLRGRRAAREHGEAPTRDTWLSLLAGTIDPRSAR